MGNFMKNMKSAAAQAKVKDHPLFTREYSSEIRNAYFSGAAACLCFLDDELDAAEQQSLRLLGLGLHLSSGEIDDVCKSVQTIGDDDKMSFLQEIFSLMDSDYLKYALLTDMHTLCLKKGALTEDEKDFLSTASEILFGEGKDLFRMWEEGLTIDNIDDFEHSEKNEPETSPERDPFYVQLEESDNIIWGEIIESLNENPEFKDKLKESTGMEDKLFLSFFIDHNVFRDQYRQFSMKDGDVNTPVFPGNPETKKMLKDLLCDDITEADLDKIHSMADVLEITLHKLLLEMNKEILDWIREKLQKEIDDTQQEIEGRLEEMKQSSRLACFAGISDEHVYVAPNIPQNKIDGAKNSYVPFFVDRDNILVLVDDTCFGGAGDGFIITHDAVFSHEIFSEPVTVYFSKSSEIKYNKNEIYIDGLKACHVSLPSAKAIEGLACGIAQLKDYTE